MRRDRPLLTALAAMGALSAALAGCGKAGGDGGASPPDAPSPGPLPAHKPPSPAAQALLDTLPPAYRTADLANGRLHFNLCRACHTIAKGGPNMTGPNLYGVFGRRVASAPGYAYSSALSARNWTWDARRLDGWLKSPRQYVPGTRMSFYGIPDDQDRRDLIAYLRLASRGGPEQ